MSIRLGPYLIKQNDVEVLTFPKNTSTSKSVSISPGVCDVVVSVDDIAYQCCYNIKNTITNQSISQEFIDDSLLCLIVVDNDIFTVHASSISNLDDIVCSPCESAIVLSENPNSLPEPFPSEIPDTSPVDISNIPLTTSSVDNQQGSWINMPGTSGNSLRDTICDPEIDVSSSVGIQNCESHQNPDIAMLSSGHAVLAFEDRDTDGVTKILVQIFHTSVKNKIKYYRSLSRGRLVNDLNSSIGTFEVYDDLGVLVYQNCSLGMLNGPLGKQIFTITNIQRIETDGTFTKFVINFNMPAITPVFSDSNDDFNVSWVIIDLSDSTLPSESSLSSILDIGYHLDSLGQKTPVANPSVSVPQNSTIIGGELYLYLTYQAFENAVWNIYAKQIRISEQPSSQPLYQDPFNFDQQSGIYTPLTLMSYSIITYVLKEVERADSSYVVGRFYAYATLPLQSGQTEESTLQIVNCDIGDVVYSPVFGTSSSLDGRNAIVEIFHSLTSGPCIAADPGWTSSSIGLEYNDITTPTLETFSLTSLCSQIYVHPDTVNWCVFQPSCLQISVFKANQCDLEYLTLPTSDTLPIYLQAKELYLLNYQNNIITRVEYELSTKFYSNITSTENFSDNYLSILERDDSNFSSSFFRKARILITYNGDLLDKWTQDIDQFSFSSSGINTTEALKGLTNLPFSIYSDKIYNIDPVFLLGNTNNWVYFLNEEEPVIQYPFIGYLSSAQSDNIFIDANAIRPKIKINNRNDVFIVYESYSSGLPQIKIVGTGDFSKTSITGATGKRITKFITSDDFKFSYNVTTNELNQLPDIVIDKSDTVHLAWQSNRDGNWEIYYANGYNMFEEKRITNHPSRSSFPKIEISDSGDIFIVYHDQRFGLYEILLSYKKEVRTIPLLQQNSYLASLANDYSHYTNVLPLSITLPPLASSPVFGGFYGTKTTLDLGNVDNALFLFDKNTGEATCKLNTNPYHICSLATFQNGSLYGITCDNELLEVNINSEYVSIIDIGTLPSVRTELFSVFPVDINQNEQGYEVSLQWLVSDPVQIYANNFRFQGSVPPSDYGVLSFCSGPLEYKFNNSAWSQFKPTITSDGILYARHVGFPSSESFAYFKSVSYFMNTESIPPLLTPLDYAYGIETSMWNLVWSKPDSIQLASPHSDKPVNIYYKITSSPYSDQIIDTGTASPLNYDGFVFSLNSFDIKNIPLPAGNIVTVRAMAVLSPDVNTGWGRDTAVTYISQTVQSHKPLISPGNGNFSSPQNVTISNNGYPFLYRRITTNDPSSLNNPFGTRSSTCYDGWSSSSGAPVTIQLITGINNNIGAVGKESNKYYSPLTSAFFTFGSENNPVFSPTSGSWCEGDLQVTISGPIGDLIYYTKAEYIDTPGISPSDPTTSSTLYTGPIFLSSTYTRFKAISVNTFNNNQSSVVSKDYLHISCSPVFDPSGNPSFTYYGSLTINVTCSTPNAVVRYSLDSNSYAVKDWNNSSNDVGIDIQPGLDGLVNDTITLSGGNITLSAISYLPDHSRSNSSYTIGIFNESPIVPVPAFNPYTSIVTNQSGFLIYEYNFIDSVEVTITCQDDQAIIRFTTDGSYPSASSNIYSGPITITVTTLIAARAFKSGKTPSQASYGNYTKIGEHYSATIKDAAADSSDRLWVVYIEDNPVITGNELSISLINHITAEELINSGPLFSGLNSDSESGLAINTINGEFFVTFRKEDVYQLYKSTYPVVSPSSASFNFNVINNNLTQNIIKLSFDTDQGLFGFDEFNNFYSIDTANGNITLINSVSAVDDCNPISITSGLSLAILPDALDPIPLSDFYHIIIEFYDNIKLLGSPYLLIDSRTNLEAFIGEEPYFSTANGIYLTTGESRIVFFNASQPRLGLDNLSYPYPFDTNIAYFPKVRLIQMSTGETIDLSVPQNSSFSCNKCSKYATNSTDLTGCSYSWTINNSSNINVDYYFKVIFYTHDNEFKDLLKEYKTETLTDLIYFEVNNNKLSTSNITIPPNTTYFIQIYPGLDENNGMICGLNYIAKVYFSTDQINWNEVLDQTSIFYCECSSSIYDNSIKRIESIGRWVSSNNGQSDTRISDTTKNNLKPALNSRSDGRIIILWGSENGNQSIIGSSFKIDESDNVHFSGTLSQFDYDFNIEGSNIKFKQDLFDRIISVYEKLHLVTDFTDNNKLPYSTISYKVCDVIDDAQDISNQCDYSKLKNTITTSDPYIFETIVKKIQIKEDNVKYFTRNTANKTVPVIDDCRITLCIFGTPEITAFRIRNENESFYHDWCPWNPVLGDYYLEYNWTLSPGSGFKNICIQVVTYNGITSEFCLPVIADYNSISYSVRLCEDSSYAIDLPLYKGFFVAATQGQLDQDQNEVKDIFVEIIPEIKIDNDTIIFDVLMQGDESFYDLIANKVIEIVDKSVFRGKITIKKDRFRSSTDGMAQIVPYFGSVCEHQNKTIQVNIKQKDQYNILSTIDQREKQITDLSIYRDEQEGRIGTPILLRPTQDDPFMIFGNPDYFLK